MPRKWQCMLRDTRGRWESVKIDKRGSREHCGSARRIRIRSALPPRLIVTYAIRRRGTDYWQIPCERVHLTRVFVALFGPYLRALVEENSKFPPVVFAPRRFIHPSRLRHYIRILCASIVWFSDVWHDKFSRKYIFTMAGRYYERLVFKVRSILSIKLIFFVLNNNGTWKNFVRSKLLLLNC